MTNEKITFAFPDEDIMNAFIQCLEGVKANNRFSILLMDRDGEHIIKEVSLRGEEDKDSLFLKEVVVDESDDWRGERFGQLTFFNLENLEDSDDGEGDE